MRTAITPPNINTKRVFKYQTEGDPLQKIYNYRYKETKKDMLSVLLNKKMSLFEFVSYFDSKGAPRSKVPLFNHLEEMVTDGFLQKGAGSGRTRAVYSLTAQGRTFLLSCANKESLDYKAAKIKADTDPLVFSIYREIVKYPYGIGSKTIQGLFSAKRESPENIKKALATLEKERLVEHGVKEFPTPWLPKDKQPKGHGDLHATAYSIALLHPQIKEELVERNNNHSRGMLEGVELAGGGATKISDRTKEHFVTLMAASNPFLEYRDLFLEYCSRVGYSLSAPCDSEKEKATLGDIEVAIGFSALSKKINKFLEIQVPLARLDRTFNKAMTQVTKIILNYYKSAMETALDAIDKAED